MRACCVLARHTALLHSHEAVLEVRKVAYNLSCMPLQLVLQSVVTKPAHMDTVSLRSALHAIKRWMALVS